MIVSFRDGAAEDLFNGVNSKRARKACPRSLWVVASRKLDQLDSVLLLDELKVPPRNRLEALRCNRRGQYSVRINEHNAEYRVMPVKVLCGVRRFLAKFAVALGLV